MIHPLILWRLARRARGTVSPDTAGRPPHRERRSSAVRPHDQAATDDLAVPPAAPPPLKATRPMTAPCDVPNCVGHRTRA